MFIAIRSPRDEKLRNTVKVRKLEKDPMETAVMTEMTEGTRR